MRPFQDLTEILISAWIIADGDTHIPTANGLFDRALFAVVQQGAFPAWARERLHFVDTRVGLQCVELPAVWDWAQRAQLASTPTPTSQLAEVLVSRRAALLMLEDLGVSEDDARRWGMLLRRALREAERQQLEES